MSKVERQNMKQNVQQDQGTPELIKRIMGVVFYMGLFVFLLSSIDHVAWFFHLYEPVVPKEEITWATMLPSYGKAAALDVAVFFLAYVAATGQTADKVVTWFFTIVLSGVSLYANYIYAMYHSPEQQSNVWGIVLIGNMTTGWLSPIIASSYPIFACIFMYLIERVISRKAETVEEMRARLNALKERKAIEQQIKAVDRGKVKSASIDAIDSGFELFNHLKRKLSKEPEQDVQSHTDADEELPSTPQETEDLESINLASIPHPQAVQDALQSHTLASGSEQELGNGQWSWQGFSSRATLPIEEAARVLHLSLNTTKNLRRKGVLKTASLNADRITIASIKAYDEKRPKRHQKGHMVAINDEPKIERDMSS